MSAIDTQGSARQNADLTFKLNRHFGRHGWLRLTPAYSVKLVSEILAGSDRGIRVLDPFSGAGTTSLVCERLGLDSIGIDTSAEYIKLAEARIAEDEQKRIDEQIKQIRKEAKLASKNG